MAKKKSKRQPANDDANVVRIKAGAPTTKKNKPAEEAVVIKSTKTAKKAAESKPVKAKRVKKPGSPKGWTKPLRLIGGYFKGAWEELRQVRWPTRKATWSMTLAVLIYSAFFVAVILLLDAGFKYLFELILGT